MAKSEDDASLATAEQVARRMVEDAGADAVVVLWTSQRRRATRIYRHQVGNQMLCDALVNRVAADQNAPVEGESA